MTIEQHKIEKLCSVQQGATLGRIKVEDGEQLPLIQIRHLSGLELSGEPDLATFDDEKAEGYRLEANQVVVSLRGIPIKASVVREPYVGAICGSNVAVLTIKDPNRCDPYYLAGLLSSKYLNARLSSLIGGSTVPSLSVRQLREFKIPVPAIADQRTLVRAFKGFETYEHVTEQLLTAHAQRLEAHLALALEESSDQ